MNSKQLADKYSIRERIALKKQRINNEPGFGSCGLCGRAWNICKPHDTPYIENKACFVLCEECWSLLVPTERLPYYKDLIDRRKQYDDRIKMFVEKDEYYKMAWESMKKSVEAGL